MQPNAALMLKNIKSYVKLGLPIQPINSLRLKPGKIPKLVARANNVINKYLEQGRATKIAFRG